MLLINLLKQFLQYKYCKKVMKKHFKKNFTEKEENNFNQVAFVGYVKNSRRSEKS